MRLLTGERVVVHATPDAIWDLFGDPSSLARVLPGCSALEADGPDRFRGVLAARLAFITIHADITATLSDQVRPRSLRLELAGRPRGLAGAFRSSIPVRMEPHDGSTEVSYDVDLELSGRLATFGAPLLREVMRGQVTELVRNLEREVARDRAGPPP